jgi:hypothetical protein
LRQTIRIAIVLGLAGLAFSRTSHAAVEIQGNVAALHLTANGDPISDALAAISKVANLRYRTTVQLGTVIGGSYSGSAESVIVRLLRGYSFAIGHKGEMLEVSIYGQWLGAASTQTTQTSPFPTPVPVQTAASPERHPAVAAPPNPRRDTRYEHFRLVPSRTAAAPRDGG